MSPTQAGCATSARPAPPTTYQPCHPPVCPWARGGSRNIGTPLPFWMQALALDMARSGTSDVVGSPGAGSGLAQGPHVPGPASSRGPGAEMLAKESTASRGSSHPD